jgi:pyruvate kinase
MSARRTPSAQAFRSAPRPRTQPPRRSSARPHDRISDRELARRIDAIRRRCLTLEERHASSLQQVTRGLRPSARNLLHYVALRQDDLRDLQDDLAVRGLSSLGRCDSHVMSALEALRRVLGRLSGDTAVERVASQAPVDLHGGAARLRRHATQLFGPGSSKRWVRIMVTMPAAAARDYPMVREMVAAGMNVARINCAHDGPDVWLRIIANIKRAAKELDRSCRIMMDLAGPKLRTGAVELGRPIVSFQPERDERRWPIAPAQVLLHRAGTVAPLREQVDAVLPITGNVVDRARVEDELRFQDTRRRRRSLHVTAVEGDGVLRTECFDSVWVEAHTPIALMRDGVVIASACCSMTASSRVKSARCSRTECGWSFNAPPRRAPSCTRKRASTCLIPTSPSPPSARRISAISSSP